MRIVFIIAISACLFAGCDSTNSSVSAIDLRLSGIQFALELTHNSHLGRSFNTPESAYSATISFELFLTEDSDHEKIEQFAIIDEDNVGWVYNLEETRAAYNSERHSLIFKSEQLRIYDELRGKQLSAQFLDLDGNIVRERGFTLDNDFPLPTEASVTMGSNNEYNFLFDFYETPYDGGNLPFAVTIYNTFFSSNSVFILWLDQNNHEVGRDFINKNDFEEISSNTWELHLDSSSIPSEATSFYSIFRRGGETRGAALFTQILDLP